MCRNDLMFVAVVVIAAGLVPIAAKTDPPDPAAVATQAGQVPAPAAIRPSPIALYRTHCLACHGSDGAGKLIRPAMPEIPNFTDAKWQTGRTDADLHQSILNGKGKLMLPMKERVSAAEAMQLIQFVRGFRDGKQIVPLEEQANNAPPNTSAKTYQQYCFVCHGTDGRGTAMRASLPAIPDFSNRAWQAGVTNPQLSVSILNGKGTLMPSFRDRVSSEEAKNLAAYIRGFGPAGAGPSDAAPANDVDKQLRELQEQMKGLNQQVKDQPPPKRP